MNYLSPSPPPANTKNHPERRSYPMDNSSDVGQYNTTSAYADKRASVVNIDISRQFIGENGCNRTTERKEIKKV